MKGFIQEIEDKFSQLEEAYTFVDDVKVGQVVQSDGDTYKVVSVSKTQVKLKEIPGGKINIFPDYFGKDATTDNFWDYFDMNEANVTGNLDGGEGPPRTPNAFSKSTDEEDLDSDRIEVLGYKKTKKTNNYIKAMERFENRMEQKINEISYKEYKKDDTRKDYQKINDSIKKINSMMYKMERIVNQNARLKQESGVHNGQYWKSTQNRFQKISERMIKVAQKLKELSL